MFRAFNPYTRENTTFSEERTIEDNIHVFGVHGGGADIKGALVKLIEK